MLPLRSGILAQAINMKIFTKNHHDSLHSHPDSWYLHLDSLHFPHYHSDSPQSHPDSPCFLPDSPRSHHSPHSVPRFSILAFTDSPTVDFEKVKVSSVIPCNYSLDPYKEEVLQEILSNYIMNSKQVRLTDRQCSIFIF